MNNYSDLLQRCNTFPLTDRYRFLGFKAWDFGVKQTTYFQKFQNFTKIPPILWNTLYFFRILLKHTVFFIMYHNFETYCTFLPWAKTFETYCTFYYGVKRLQHTVFFHNVLQLLKHTAFLLCATTFETYCTFYYGARRLKHTIF